MSEIKLNKEQQDFIKYNNGNMLVSASAGSGKTTTMIYKLIDLIVKHNVPVQNLLVVTFTDAAAQEMKQKLYFELINNIKGNNYSSEKLNFLHTQLDNIMVADIGTVHSVCKKIVTKYFYAVSVEPNFKILDDVEHKSMFNMALNNVFNNYVLSDDLQFFKVFESFNEKRNFNKLKTIVGSVCEFLNEQTNPEAWFFSVIDKTTNTNLSQNVCANFLFDYYKSTFLYYENNFKNLLNVVSGVLPKQQEIVLGYYNYVKQLASQTDFLNMANVIFSDTNFIRLSPVKDPQFYDYYENLKLTVTEFKDVLKNAKRDMVTNDKSLLVKTCDGLKEIELKLFEIAQNTNKEFCRLKQNAGALDFSDLQKLTLKILEDKKIKAELIKKYSYIFVDEYQDINQIQEDIILSLTSGNNLYMIGDVKQSIYAFRQCKPEIFLTKYKQYDSDGINNKLLKLNENYRSAKNIIDFANMIFNNIITPKTIGIDYKTDAQLKTDITQYGNVRLSIVNTCNLEDDGNEGEEFSKEQLEAMVVLEEINKVLGTPYFDQKTKQTKILTYSDIAILTRDAGSFVFELYKLLSNHKIPVSANFKQSIFNSSEVMVLYSLLKLVANHTQEVELCTVLHSEMFNVSNQELSQIKLEGGNDFYSSLIDYCNNGSNKQLCNKISMFFKEVNIIRNKLAYYTIYEVMEYVLNKYDLISFYYSFPDGIYRVKNIEIFCELLKNETFNFNLNRAIEFLESLSEKKDFTISTKSQENSIKILTMHKSKGLEFPCVILCNMGKSFNNNSHTAEMVISEEFGLGLNFKDTFSRVEHSTIQKRASVLNKINQELNEQIRLLYVALTRARNNLIVVGSYNLSKFDFNKQKSINQSTNFLDLIFKGIGKMDGEINGKNSFSISFLGHNVCDVTIKNASDITINFVRENATLKPELANIDVADQIVKNVTNLNFSSSDLIATKNSVSGLLEDENYVNNSETDLTLNIDVEKEDDSSLKLGTAYHTVMQNVDYRKTQDVMELLNCLVTSKKIEREIANQINKKQIENAIESVKKLLTPTTKIFKEQQFLLNTSYNKIKLNSKDVNVLIQGVVDLILIDGNKATIIDFKTNKTHNIQQLKQKYSLQLTCYAQAVEQGFKVKVSDKMLYLFNLNRFTNV